MVAVIYAPLIPAALTLISPALSLTHWQTLFADPQLPQALLATLVSTTIAAVGALLIALLVIVALWPGPKWQRMCARLPWLLAIPHVAFATDEAMEIRAQITADNVLHWLKDDQINKVL